MLVRPAIEVAVFVTVAAVHHKTAGAGDQAIERHTATARNQIDRSIRRKGNRTSDRIMGEARTLIDARL